MGRDYTRLSVNVNQDTADAIRQMAAEQNCSMTEALRRLVGYGAIVYRTVGDVRVRRHTDGRIALCRNDMWLITSIPDVTAYPSWFPNDRLCSGEGWVELLVTQLPEPDYNCDGEDGHGNETIADQWEVGWLRDADGIITAWTNGIEIEGRFIDAEDSEIDHLESDALKLLAAIAEHRRCYAEAEVAVAACEQHRAEQEANQ